jgi:large subunit ribosomal protein L29
MKQSEIKELSVEELQEKFGIFKKNYTDLKLAHAISPLESPLQLRNVRKTIARIATELTNRELQKL